MPIMWNMSRRSRKTGYSTQRNTVSRSTSRVSRASFTNSSIGYATFFAEATGGVLLILGVQTRWVAAALLPILAGAVWAHSGNGWMFGYPNGGWEYPLYLVVLAVVLYVRRRRATKLAGRASDPAR